MGSSLGCFDDDDKDNDTVCYSLVGVTGVSLVLLLAAVLVLCCVWRKKRQWRRAGRHRLRYDIQRTAGVGDNLEVNNETYVHLPAERVTNHVQQVETSREEDKRNNQYQEVGITDYEHMYSKTVQFNASGTHDGCSQDKSQEKETSYAELSITTL